MSPNAIGALERGERRHPYPHTVRALVDALQLADAERAAFAAAVPRRGSPSATPSPTGFGAPLPTPLAPLIGRERDIAALQSLLAREDFPAADLDRPWGRGQD